MPPKKKIAALVKVQLQAGAATPAPPVGTALGPHGVNIMEFCKAYNAQTESMRGNVVPVEITIYEDRSFTFVTKTPPAPEMIKKAAGLQKGSAVPQKDKVGKITKDQVREIATTKMPDLNARDIDAAMKIIEGTARSMGVVVDKLTSYRPRTAESVVRVARWNQCRRQLWQGEAPPYRPRPPREGTDMKRSKAYRAPRKRSTSDHLYTPLEAIKFAKQGATKKFDATVDVAMRLGVDPRKADQMVRGTVNLPHGTGKTARVLVFATGDRPRPRRPPAPTRRRRRHDREGTDGWLDFDAVVATPDLMGKVGRLGRVLGPRGLMPNPKTGTVTPDVVKAVNDIKGGKIEFRVDRHANLHFIIGKASFRRPSWSENYSAALEEVLRLKPAAPRAATSRRRSSRPRWDRASRLTPT